MLDNTLIEKALPTIDPISEIDKMIEEKQGYSYLAYPGGDREREKDRYAILTLQELRQRLLTKN